MKSNNIDICVSSCVCKCARLTLHVCGKTKRQAYV